MRKLVLPIVIVVIAAAVLYVFGQGGDESPAFRASSTGIHGTSLFFDTLRHMGYSVDVSRRPLSRYTNTQYAYIIIQPSHFGRADVDDIFTWVSQGGLLVFLQNGYSTVLDGLITDGGIPFGNLMLYELGQGVVVTGRASEITNYNLMNNSETGAILHGIIHYSRANRVWFCEYYHTAVRESDNLFARLPLIARIIFVQLMLVAIMIVWHLGKRFGNAVPYYQEHEREENEHVYALARLYWKSGSAASRRKFRRDSFPASASSPKANR